MEFILADKKKKLNLAEGRIEGKITEKNLVHRKKKKKINKKKNPYTKF